MRKCSIQIFIMTAVLMIAFPLSALANEPVKAAEPSKAGNQNVDLAPSARSAILMDADSGTVIFEKSSHERLAPASITKIMTLLLIMEAIDDGKLKLNDKVQTSEYAASMGGSQIFLEPGEVMTVEEMLKGVALASGNDASVALAEKIAGTESQFVSMMNERAKQLGMNDTHFMNCNGLPTAEHYSSAHDIAIMSKELLKHEQITKYTGLYQDYLRKSSEKPFWLVNTNKLVRFYSGADGLKTGFTNEAKYCLSATAKRDGLRIIAVVMGEPTTKLRNAEVSQMFDYSFAQYMNHSLLGKGDAIGEVMVEKGSPDKLKLVAEQPYSLLLKRGSDVSQIRHELKVNDSVKAPIKKGDAIGKLVVYDGSSVVKEYPLLAPESVGRAGWWTMMKRSVKGLFS